MTQATTKLQNRVIQYLTHPATLNTPQCEDAILKAAEKVGYKQDAVRTALRQMPEIAHIGRWWESKERTAYWCGYPQNALTDKVQACLDRGEAW